MSELLDPAFVRELQLLKRRLDVAARTRLAGERLSNRRGSSVEFEQHRGYVSGDDLRRVDWLATARSGSPVIKQFRSEEDPMVRILLDRSQSLLIGEPSKLDLAKRLAAAVAYLALNGGARAQLIAGPAENGSGLQFFDSMRGGRSLVRLLKQLEALDALGPTHLSSWIRQVVSSGKRAGLLVIISDFLDPEAVLRELDLARGQGHDVALLQVIAEEELAPSWEGDLELEDVETGQRLELTLDQASLDAYLSQLLELLERLRAWSRQRGQAYVRVTQREDLVSAMRRFVLKEQD